jgi:hypothetical protein
MNTQETQEAAPDRRQGKPNIYEAMLKLKREHEILRERYESALSGRDHWRRQAEEKWAMRRELEDLLGVDHAAASDEQFKKGLDRLKEIIQERDEARNERDILRINAREISNDILIRAMENENPETQEAVERWRQGKINIFDAMARIEQQRDEAREVADLLYNYLVRPAYEVDQAIHKMMVMERYKQMKEDK